ncbi:galactinol synthase 1-like [Dendronephthya gigantea]|uniref:galactinol synthase 1-like n=1 Tax=Dendronephthya gigantea TaxID=151771 RepID=UPI00106C4BD3|nr:galactinol synthase 1-like [Dendronephthya gigantea]XP_028396338.1 galactinol synthase 1-like [Dendronephthya gigantea]
MPSRTISYIALHARSFPSILVYIRRHKLIKFFAGFLLCLLFFRLTKPNYFSYGISYAKIIYDLVNTDMQRQNDVLRQDAQLVWDLHHFQKEFMPEWCKNKVKKKRKLAWFVSMSGNSVVPGAVAVGHIIKKFSCYPNLLALVTDTVSKESRSALEATGFSVHVVESLDCNWMDKKLGYEITNKGIPGTHTRFNIWRYTQFDSIVYVDTDFFPLVNMDELFDLPKEFSAVYCGRPGVLDPCFNAGLAVFKPHLDTYQGLMEKWEELSRVIGCPNDQIVLWHYFAFNGRWNPLPYSYNVRRKIYYPMKAYHFAGYGIIPKPWELKKPPSRQEANSFPGPVVKQQETNILWWKLFYEALDAYNLHDWWKTTEFYTPITGR